MVIRSRDLKSKSQLLKTGGSQVNLGGQVPAGMKRWVTFLLLNENAAAKQAGVYLASVGVSNPTRASVVATGNRKLLVYMRTTQTSGARKPPLAIPEVQNADYPLFSIAASKWLGAVATGTSVMATVQYFDE
jgi:hypothetical protein